MKNSPLDGHFSYGRLLRFTVPSVVMMIFVSIYGVIDGIFVSNFVGKTPFAAVNLIFPFLMVFSALGFMIGTGGSALVGKTLGEGENDRANRLFSMLLGVSLVGAVVLTVLGLLFLRPIAALLGAEGEMLECCVTYGRILMIVLPAFVLQNEFQSFFVTAGKPRLGLAVTVAAGVTNIVLDALFVAVFRWGLEGAAWATALSQTVGGVLPLFYFGRRNSSLLRLCRFTFDGGALLRVCTNGSSELMNNLSMSLVSMLYNVQLLRLAGENGIAAYGVVMYVNFIFVSVFIGYAVGSAPPVSFHFGAGNRPELRSLLRKSVLLLAVAGVLLTALALLLAPALSGVFVGYDRELYQMTLRAFQLCSLSFLVSGINIFGSSYYTALNNGLVSALLSFSRTLVFQLAALYLLPLWWGLDGIWLAGPASELLCLVMTAAFLVHARRRGALRE
ncbi:MAG: MATE family efflux transporter [Clostridia bacterium]|nr:MATE family efflux transporter [Clostridia bacterium]MBR2407274.1 MATE family efflux transporter [Clostridia bacterium]